MFDPINPSAPVTKAVFFIRVLEQVLSSAENSMDLHNFESYKNGVNFVTQCAGIKAAHQWIKLHLAIKEVGAEIPPSWHDLLSPTDRRANNGNRPTFRVLPQIGP